MAPADASASLPNVSSKNLVPGDGPASPSKQGELTSSALRRAVSRLGSGQPPPRGVRVVDGRVQVEVLHGLGRQAIRATVASVGGEVVGGVGRGLSEALVPPSGLLQLERTRGIRFVRPPLRTDIPAGVAQSGSGAVDAQSGSVVGEEVSKTNAAAWHAAGWDGAGIKIGIVDSFGGTLWTNAQAAGEVPSPSGTFCRQNGAACDVFAGTSSHGVLVGEVLHDMAPRASIYLARARSPADLQAAVDYFASQGVHVISRSLTAEYDGPGNGTGAIANVIDNAVARGIAWVNSAGNNAGNPSEGSYWRGSWADANANNFLDFAPGDEGLGFNCWFINGLRWSDWGANRTDYDAYIYDDFGLTVVEDSSEDNQQAGASPIETLTCTGASNDIDYLVIRRFNSGGGTAGDVLEYMTNGLPVQYSSNPFSASGPAADTASAGGLAIGAIDPPLGSLIATYSAWGPTNDGRVKPDLSAAANMASFTEPKFSGTSAATPVAAGAAALVRQAFPSMAPSDVKTFLLGATLDRGAPGSDNVYGRGELVLGAAPSSSSGGGGSPAPVPPRVVPARVDRTRPIMLTFRVSPSVFAASRRGATIARGVGSNVRYRLSEAGRVRFRISRYLGVGRRVRGKCRRTTAGNRRARRCKRYRTLPGSFARASRRGRNNFGFTGRYRGRRLKPARYRLSGVATDKARNRSLTERATFRITAP